MLNSNTSDAECVITEYNLPVYMLAMLLHVFDIESMEATRLLDQV